MTDDMQQIEQDFKLSWRKIAASLEQTAQNDVLSQYKLSLIGEMMKRGYDGHFMLTFESYSLFLSSTLDREHRVQEPYIELMIVHDWLFVTYIRLKDQSRISMHFQEIQYNTEIDRLIQHLQQFPKYPTSMLLQIEHDFILSWWSVERYFRDHSSKPHWEYLDHMVQIILVMYARGYYSLLRAGVSLTRLIVSRARYHGLHDFQPSIQFEILEDTLTVTYWNSVEEFKLLVNPIEYNEEIDALVQRLLQEPIT